LADESVITEELRSMLGVEAEPEVFEVEKGHIIRFAQAIGDPNPLWNDREYARKSNYDDIIAPPMFLIDEGLTKFADRLIKLKNPLPSTLNGGTEIEYYKPMKPGDIITTVAKLIDLKEKSGGSGKLLFQIVEVTYTNQKGELVAKCRDTFVRR
jgi:acyl dehydratase